MRPDWGDGEQLRGAMVAAHTAGWSWPRTFTEVCRMLTDDQARPSDLRDASRQPLDRNRPTDPDAVQQAAAGAKAALAGALIELDQQRAEREQAERDERNRQLAEAADALAASRGGDAG